MLVVLAWCGVRWAARRLDRKRFAQKYRVAVRRRVAVLPHLVFAVFVVVNGWLALFCLAKLLHAPGVSQSLVDVFGWRAYFLVLRFLRLLLVSV